MNKVWFLIGIVTMLVSMGMTANAAEATSDNYQYAELEEGTIAITKYSGSEKDVVIPEQIGGKTVTKIAKNAFYFNQELETIVIPNSVTSIESYAFEDCIKLNKITFSENLEELQDGAFAGCNGLKKVQIPKSIKYAGGLGLTVGPFSNCKNLVKIEFEDGITEIPGALFGYCTGLKEITIPNTVTSIGDYAFTNCSVLEVVHMSNGVKSIGEGSFYKCFKLKEINLPESLTQIGGLSFAYCYALSEIQLPAKLECLGLGTFTLCKALKEITLPKSWKETITTEKYANKGAVIANCDSLEKIVLEDGMTEVPDYLVHYCNKLSEIVLPGTVCKIGELAFYSNNGLKALSLPDSVAEIGTRAFDRCKNLKEIQWSAGLKVIGKNAFGSTAFVELEIPDQVEVLGTYAFAGSKLEKVTLGAGLKEIGINPFYQAENLTRIYLKEANPFFREIGGAIYNQKVTTMVLGCRCSTEIVIPESVTEILEEACYGDGMLENVVFPSGIQLIGQGAFDATPFLANAQFENGVLIVGDYIYRINKESIDGEYTVPEGIVGIYASTFSGCKKLTKINLPNSLRTIGDNAFSGSSLKEVSFGEGLQTIGEGAFFSCKNLEEINLPDSVETIGERAFAFSGVKKISLGSKLRNIGYGIVDNTPLAAEKPILFTDNWLLSAPHSSGTIYDYCNIDPGTVGISASCFAGQQYMAALTLPNTLKYINKYAFSGVGYLKEVSIPDSVEYVDEYAFSECAQLEKLTIGCSVKELGECAFGLNSMLQEIHFLGDAPQMPKTAEGQKGLFEGVTATVYYPGGNVTWTAAIKQNYGGNLTWVEVEDASSKSNPFGDVSTSEWKYSFAKYVYNKGIMTGKGTTLDGKVLFDPDNSLTRAELAQILYSMEGKPAIEYSNIFVDVPQGQWYTKAVLWANENGVATGVGEGKFNPNGKITREQVATMLKKYAVLKGKDNEERVALDIYADFQSVSAWAQDNMSWAVANGIISGKTGTEGGKLLDAKGNATRAECAAMLKSYSLKFD